MNVTLCLSVKTSVRTGALIALPSFPLSNVFGRNPTRLPSAIGVERRLFIARLNPNLVSPRLISPTGNATVCLICLDSLPGLYTHPPGLLHVFSYRTIFSEVKFAQGKLQENLNTEERVGKTMRRLWFSDSCEYVTDKFLWSRSGGISA